MRGTSVALASPAGWYANPEGRDRRSWGWEHWSERYLQSNEEAGI